MLKVIFNGELVQFLPVFSQLGIIFAFLFCFPFRERVIFKNSHFMLKITILSLKIVLLRGQFSLNVFELILS